MSMPTMRAFFPNATPQSIAVLIRQAVQGRKIGEIMDLQTPAGELVVSISKMGTSILRFSTVARDGGIECALTEEKLALAHRPFRDEVKSKLSKIVEQVGGTILHM